METVRKSGTTILLITLPLISVVPIAHPCDRDELSHWDTSFVPHVNSPEMEEARGGANHLFACSQSLLGSGNNVLGGAVADWVRAYNGLGVQWLIGLEHWTGFESCWQNSASELRQFRLPHFASVFPRRH